MMNKVIFILIGFLYLSCNSRKEKEYYPLRVISKSKSEELFFFRVKLFEKGKVVKDTTASWERILIPRDVETIIIDYAGHYPKYVSVNELKNDSVVTLNISPVLDRTGGMGVDTLLNSMHEAIEKDIEEWNDKYGEK